MRITILILILTGAGCVSVQSSQEATAGQTVIAYAQDGTSFIAPARLRVNVCTMGTQFPKILIGLENNSKGYVTIRLKDSQGKNIHRPIFEYRKSRVVKFDMSHVENGLYIVEVANKHEHYRYQLEISSMFLRSIEVKPNVLAKLK
jgi:hypothetical protein